MGLNLILSGSSKPSIINKLMPNRQPDPKKWEIIKFLESGRNLLVKIRYPDCTNYEGMKILLYLNTTMQQLKDQGTIDPHFSNNKKFKSPFARFKPTKDGWNVGLDVLFRLA